jgi:hypothetical protein
VVCNTSHDMLDQIFHHNTTRQHPTKFSQLPDSPGLRIPQFLPTPQIFRSVGCTSRERSTGPDGPLRQLSAAAVAAACNAVSPRMAAAAPRVTSGRRPERRRPRETAARSASGWAWKLVGPRTCGT